jgi:hypothetical protein
VRNHDAFSDGYSHPVDHSLLSITGYIYGPPFLFAHRGVKLESHGLVDTVHLPSAPLAVRTWAWVSSLPKVTREATLLTVEGLRLAINAAGKVVFTDLPIADCRRGNGR